MHHPWLSNWYLPMENREITQSPLELAMEYIANNPSLTDILDDAAFATFFQYPEECINKHKAVLNYMATSFGFTPEMIEEHCKEFLVDSCKHVSDLKAKEAQNN